MNKLLMLVIGGSIGTVARYALSTTINQFAGLRFPYGTMAVNMIGCFLIGFFIILAEEKLLIDTSMRLLLIFGFCGAFTTFSTFIYESANLIREGDSLAAFINILLSVVLGFILFRLGIAAAELI